MPIQTDTSLFAIGFIIYNAEEKSLDRIIKIANAGFFIYIFDNSPSSFISKNNFTNNANIFYITSGKNLGLGCGLSMICATAYYNSYKFLLFLDQDTIFTDKTLNFVSNYLKKLSLIDQSKYAALVFNGKNNQNNAINTVLLAISSGSLFSLKALKNIGWHNENYFVDCVDYEFCLRAKYHGYEIGSISNTPDFDHISEQPDQQRSFFGKVIFLRRYSAMRMQDAFLAYSKLIFFCLNKNKISDTFFVFRSLVMYFLGQLLARIFLK